MFMGNTGDVKHPSTFEKLVRQKIPQKIYTSGGSMTSCETPLVVFKHPENLYAAKVSSFAIGKNIFVNTQYYLGIAILFKANQCVQRSTNQRTIIGPPVKDVGVYQFRRGQYENVK
jgi:hypothetical protein